MFARPSKQIPGKWQLVEYYLETGEVLQNISEAQLKAEKRNWDIDFNDKNSFSHQCNLPVSLISGIKNGSWQISRNFITLYSLEDLKMHVEFQFAIDKGQLRLLKKDEKGSIEFFGFFNRIS